jgi:site-specific DNA-methyltransferase (adenine-specific)
MVGAAQLGRSSVGIDINPLATFVSQVKLQVLSEEQIQKVRWFSQHFVKVADKADLYPAPSLQIIEKVFEPVILDTLLRVRTSIYLFTDKDKVLRDFLNLAWVSILETVGSYFKEGNGIKYRNRKRLKTGYIRREEGVWQRERFGENQQEFVYQAFFNQLSMMIDDFGCWEKGTWHLQNVLEGSALQMHQMLRGATFDSIMFSPPYANRFDYFESLKVELWFGGFVNSYEDLNKLRKESLRSHLGADLYRSTMPINGLEELISLMDKTSSSWRMRVPSALRGYFDDMYQVLDQCRQATPNGRCCIVVGNSAFAGVVIPTDCLLAHLGKQVGFQKATLFPVRHLTVAPQQRAMLSGLEDFMRETVVVLE